MPAALLGAGNLARATPVLDQTFDAVAAGSSGGLNIESTQEVAQTFRVGVEGKLVSLGIQVRRYGFDLPDADLLVELRPTIAGLPDADDASVLAALTIPATLVPLFVPIVDTFVEVDLGPYSVFVNPGDELAIVLRNPGTGVYVWLNAVDDPYSGGATYARRFSPDWGQVQPNLDSGFQTYVPEPGALELAGAALLMLLVLLRSKQARHSP